MGAKSGTDYLLDTNVFIQARNLQYGFDFCPAFRDWLIEQNRAGKVASIEKVADELHKVKDDLSAWAKARGDGFFLKPDDETVSKFFTVSAWATGNEYQPVAVNEFLDKTDCGLVAHALAHNCTVVTHEVFSNSTGRIKIPNACRAFDLHCINP